jgi:tRNA 2-thiouridine synthesizing protein A
MTSQVDLMVDITGLVCPVPLIKTRRALKQSSDNQIIKFVGTKKEDISREEILIALDNLNQEVLDINIKDNGDWIILVKKQTAT